MPDHDDCLRAALALAFRHFDDESTTDAERDAVLRSLATHAASPEAEAASRALFHRESAKRAQLQLGLALGVFAKGRA